MWRAASASKGEAAYRFQPELLALVKYPNVAVWVTEQGRPRRRRITRSAACIRTCNRCLDAFGPERIFLGHRHHPDCRCSLAAMRDLVHRGACHGLKGHGLDLVMGEALCKLDRLTAPRRRRKLKAWTPSKTTRLQRAALAPKPSSSNSGYEFLHAGLASGPSPR